MTMSPEDAAAMFGLAPLPEPSQSAELTEEAIEAAQAELAAELALTLESGDFADDAPDSRTNLRVKVSWLGRMHMPNGRVVELEVRDISEGGVGLTSDEPIPADTVVNFEMDVPSLDGGGEITVVNGVIKTTYSVAHGSNVLCGCTWQMRPAGLDLVKMWIKRLWG